MGIVERALANKENPVPTMAVTEQQECINILLRAFMNDEISRENLNRGIIEFQEVYGVRLAFAGPLYGLLRKIGMGQEDARDAAYEERSHFIKARQRNMSPSCNIVFSQDEDTGEMKLHIFTRYVLPESQPDEDLKGSIRDISLAPEYPSKDDLAKLP